MNAKKGTGRMWPRLLTVDTYRDREWVSVCVWVSDKGIYRDGGWRRVFIRVLYIFHCLHFITDSQITHEILKIKKMGKKYTHSKKISQDFGRSLTDLLGWPFLPCPFLGLSKTMVHILNHKVLGKGPSSRYVLLSVAKYVHNWLNTNLMGKNTVILNTLLIVWLPFGYLVNTSGNKLPPLTIGQFLKGQEAVYWVESSG